MAYTQHNFVSGMKFTGADAAEMDEQIDRNETDIRSLETGLGSVPAERKADIRTLRLEADADSILFYYGNELLSSVAMPDVSSLIPCTGLTASADLSALMVGGTASIQAQKQPSDCNQSLRFLSSDTGVVTVNSLGVVTAVGSGTATITVSCGSKSVTLQAYVKRKVLFAGNVGIVSWLAQNTFMSYAGITFNNDGSNTYIGNIPYSFEKFCLRPGETCTLRRLDNHVNIGLSEIFKETEGKTMHLVDLLEDNDRYIIDGSTEVAKNVRTDNSLLTYTNNTANTLYLAFTISLDAGWKSAAEVIADIDSYLELVVGPASGA